VAGGHRPGPDDEYCGWLRPSIWSTLHGIDGLKGIHRDGNTIVIGAMTTQHQFAASDEIAKSVPILHETALLIADPQVRYREAPSAAMSPTAIPATTCRR